MYKNRSIYTGCEWRKLKAYRENGKFEGERVCASSKTITYHHRMFFQIHNVIARFCNIFSTVCLMWWRTSAFFQPLKLFHACHYCSQASHISRSHRNICCFRLFFFYNVDIRKWKTWKENFWYPFPRSFIFELNSHTYSDIRIHPYI